MVAAGTESFFLHILRKSMIAIGRDLLMELGFVVFSWEEIDIFGALLLFASSMFVERVGGDHIELADRVFIEHSEWIRLLLWLLLNHMNKNQ